MRCLGIVFFILIALPSFAADRVALLVGNGAYALPDMSLRNPVNDVDALEKAFTDLGFEVHTVKNASRSEMREGLEWLEREGAGAEMAVFFYAGHGVQVEGENYLIGADLPRLEAEAIGSASMTLNDVRQTLARARPKLGMVLLDACRDNPFAASGKTLPGLAVASGGAGTLVAYATDPGNVAYDGAEDNSVFTTALLNTLSTPGLEVRIMFGRVRQSVIRQTEGRQIPWVEEAVLGEHYMVAPAEEGFWSVARSDEVSLWRSASANDDIDELNRYIDRYPEGLFAGFARARIRELEAPLIRVVDTSAPAEQVLASYDPDSVVAALDLLGYAPQTRGIVPARTELVQAFNAWRATQPDPDAVSPEILLRDAARLTMFLAASTAQRIRTDLNKLSTIETVIGLLENDIAEIREIAKRLQEAQDLLPQMDQERMVALEQREIVERRLDSGREYYQRLVLLAEDHFKRQTTTDLLSRAPQTRGGLIEMHGSVFNDARVFVDQVDKIAGRPRGSYVWLSDFVTERGTQ